MRVVRTPEKKRPSVAAITPHASAFAFDDAIRREGFAAMLTGMAMESIPASRSLPAMIPGQS